MLYDCVYAMGCDVWEMCITAYVVYSQHSIAFAIVLLLFSSRSLSLSFPRSSIEFWFHWLYELAYTQSTHRILYLHTLTTSSTAASDCFSFLSSSPKFYLSPFIRFDFDSLSLALSLLTPIEVYEESVKLCVILCSPFCLCVSVCPRRRRRCCALYIPYNSFVSLLCCCPYGLWLSRYNINIWKHTEKKTTGPRRRQQTQSHTHSQYPNTL